MKAKAKSSFIGRFQKGEVYEVLSVDSQYILIREPDGSLVWNWIGAFDIVDSSEVIGNIKMKVNWNVL